MKKADVVKFVKGVQRGVGKHSPEILTGIGVAGMITTTVLAVKATPKAIELIEEAKYEKTMKIQNETRNLKPIEVVKVAWKPYIPAVITGVASTICLIGSCKVSTRRMAALTTAYKLSETALTEFKEKAVETIGEKKVKDIKDKISKDKVDENPVSKNNIIITEKGNTLCYDAAAGRYFKSDIDKIKKAVNEINRQMIYDQYVSLNEFYDELGLAHTELGDELGWNLDFGLVEVDFSSQIADDGTPCIVISYNVAPRYDYSKLI